MSKCTHEYMFIYMQNSFQNRSITLFKMKQTNLAHFIWPDEPLGGRVNVFWETGTRSGWFNHGIRMPRLTLESFRQENGKLAHGPNLDQELKMAFKHF